MMNKKNIMYVINDDGIVHAKKGMNICAKNMY